eukprot:Em0015g815a
MASQVLTRLADTSPDKIFSMPTKGTIIQFFVELEGLQTNALVSHDESTKHVKTDDWKTTRQDDPGSNIAHFVLRHNDPNTNCLL